MEEPEKKEHEKLTRKHRTKNGRSEEKRTLEQKLNKEKIQKKGKMRENAKQVAKTHARKPRHVRTRNAPGCTRGIQLLKHQNHHKCAIHGIQSVKRICSYLV